MPIKRKVACEFFQVICLALALLTMNPSPTNCQVGTVSNSFPHDIFTFHANAGSMLQVDGNWGSSRDFSLRLFSPGSDIVKGGEYHCECGSNEPKSFQEELDQSGDWVLWVVREYDSYSYYEISAQLNGATIITYGGDIHPQMMITEFSIDQAPCTLEISYLTLMGLHEVSIFSPTNNAQGSSSSAFLTFNSPVSTPVDRESSISLNGNYYLRVTQRVFSSHPTQDYTLTYSCMPCDPTTIPNCVECESGGDCTECEVGYYVNSGGCTVCPSLTNCSDCSAPTVCTACVANNILNSSDATCQPCQVHLPGCLTCDNSTHCTSCNSSLTLDSSDNTCRTCEQIMGTGCVNCTDSTCLNCTSPMFLVSNPTNDSCVDCNIANCHTCAQPVPLGNLTCSQCDTNYLLQSSTSCQHCSYFYTHCEQCDQTNLCTLCSEGHYRLNSTSCPQCSSVIAQCANCSSDGTQCFDCLDDTTVLNGAGTQCQPCSSLIDHCHQCYSETVCTQCLSDNRSFFDSPICSLCNTTMTACETCTSSTTCLTVYDDTYTVLSPGHGTDLCSSQITNCHRCSSTSICLECLENTSYHDNNTWSCPLCGNAMTACQTCSSSDTCLTVDDDTYVAMGPGAGTETCSTILSNCLRCSSTSNCTECIDNTAYLNSTAGSCPPCSNAMTACATCTAPDTCLTVNDDTYLVMAPGSGTEPCNSQLENCLRCTSATVCTECIDNRSFFDPSTDMCPLCSTTMQACETCSSNSTCLSVNDDTYAVVGTGNGTELCSSLIANCRRCSNQTFCIQCEASFFLPIGGAPECTQCSDFCNVCESPSNCTECESGFEIDANSSCECTQGWSVPKGCTQIYGCNSAYKFSEESEFWFDCLSCEDKEYFDYDPLSKSCVCKQGYKFDGSECVEQCGDGVHIRQECDDGNKISGDGCSFECKVEEGFVCKPLYSYQKSNCLISTAMSITYLYVSKVDGKNAVRAHFQVEPLRAELSLYDIKSLVTIDSGHSTAASESQVQQQISRAVSRFSHERDLSNRVSKSQTLFNLSSVWFDSEAGKILCEFDYPTQSFDSQLNSSTLIHFNFSSIVNQFSAVTFTLDTESMYPPLSSSEYSDLFNAIQTLSTILPYLCFLQFGASIFVHKMVGVEIITTVQLVFVLGLLTTNEESSLSPVFKTLQPLSLALGVTSIVTGSSTELISPQKYRYITEDRAMLYNLNLLLALYFAVSLGFFVLKFSLVRKKIIYKNYLSAIKALVAKKRKTSKRLPEGGTTNKKEDEQLKTEIQEKKFMLSDEIHALQRKLSIFSERVFEPFSLLMLAPCLTIVQTQFFTQNKQSENQDAVSWSIALQIPICLLVLGQCSFYVRKISSPKNSMESPQFYSLSESMRNEGAQKKYLGAFIGLLILLSMLVVLGVEEEKLTKVSGFFILGVGIASAIGHFCYSPYLFSFHNRCVTFNMFVVSEFAAILVCFLSEVLQEELPLHLGLLAVVLSLYVATFLGFYRLYIEFNEQNKCEISLKGVSVIQNVAKSKQKHTEQKKNIRETFAHNPYIFRPTNIQSFCTGEEEVDDFNQEKEDEFVGSKEELKRIKERLQREFTLYSKEDTNF